MGSRSSDISRSPRDRWVAPESGELPFRLTRPGFLPELREIGPSGDVDVFVLPSVSTVDAPLVAAGECEARRDADASDRGEGLIVDMEPLGPSDEEAFRAYFEAHLQVMASRESQPTTSSCTSSG
jgi:hypothetical protein